MLKIIKRTVKGIIPKSMYKWLVHKRIKQVNRPVYKRVLKEMLNSEDSTIKHYGKLLKRKGELSVFLGKWTENHPKYCKVSRDDGGYYVMHNSPCGNWSGKMYFPQEWSEEECGRYYSGLMKEQDKESPHLYFAESLVSALDLNGTVIDCGAAEGVFVLDVVGGAKKVYCFEPDDTWKNALKNTIAPYGEKCVLVEKFVGLTNPKNNTIGLDDFFGENMPKDVRLIKMDIEGFEQDALRGMKTLLSINPQAILLVCAYHSQDAEKEIRELMEPLGYRVTPRKNYMMIVLDENASYPYIRHGVLEIRKNIND